MSANAANIDLIGNIGNPPQFKHKEGQTPFAVFTMAVNRRKRRDEEKETEPMWFKITLWGHQAETAVKYATKGMPVYVEGRFNVEEWDDREGQKRYTLEVAATDFQMLGESIFAESERLEREAIAREGSGSRL